MGVASRRYRDPPVVEALSEIYFAGSVWDMTVPGQFYERVRKGFPKKEQVDAMGLELQLGPQQAEARMTPGQPRVRFSREDGSRMVQLARDLLVVNQLRPYSHFEQWRPLVLEMLSLYRELARPSGIERLGLRYINNVVIPHERFRMEKYFRIYPEVPGDEHGSFLMRLQLPALHAGHNLIVTFGTALPEREGSLAELLDLYDIFPMEGADARARMWNGVVRPL